jgi:hypothetical protein
MDWQDHPDVIPCSDADEKSRKEHPEVAKALRDRKAQRIQANGKQLCANVRGNDNELESRDCQFSLRTRPQTMVTIDGGGQFVFKKIIYPSVPTTEVESRSHLHEVAKRKQRIRVTRASNTFGNVTRAETHRPFKFERLLVPE